MREIFTQPIRVLILDEKHRSSGEFVNKEGVTVSYEAGYILSTISYGGKRATDIKKYTVLPSSEGLVSEKLKNAGWATLVELHLDGGKVVDITVIVDWSDEAPIE